MNMFPCWVSCQTVFAESEVFRMQLERDAQQLLEQTLAQLMGNDGGGASGSTGVVALDCVYLLRLMPLVMTAPQLIPHLLPLVQNMSQQRSYAQGKAFVYLFQRTCQVPERVFSCYYVVVLQLACVKIGYMRGIW